MSDESLYYIIIISIIILIAIVYIGGKISYKSEKKEKLSEKKAKCAIACQYLSGLEQLVEGTFCNIYADEEKLRIITQETTPITLNLDLSKIKVFQKIEFDKTKPHLIGFALVHQHTYDKYIVIRYLSNNDEIKEIYFAFDTNTKQVLDNESLTSICDIFDYVNARIPKQESVIDL